MTTTVPPVTMCPTWCSATDHSGRDHWRSLGEVPATAGELRAERTDGVTPLVSVSLHQHPDEFDGAVQAVLNVWRPGCTDAEVHLRPREARALIAKLSDALALLDDMLTNGSRVADQGDTAVDSEYEVKPAGASAVTATTTPVATCPTWCELPAWHPYLDVDSVDCYRTHRVSFGEDVRVYQDEVKLYEEETLGGLRHAWINAEVSIGEGSADDDEQLARQLAGVSPLSS